ncbi:MAG TPA: aldo/keto reductase [Armatimonadaceae bacterium]|nr:aldo/keto reductase [Armatimonadaceae bacterium]
MEYRILGRTGLRVSALGFGAAPIGLLGTEQDRAAGVLNLLLDSGVNLIDTAASYAGSEEAIGQAVGHRRGEYVLVSKCGRASDDLPGEDWSPKLIAATVERALRRLRTDHLDVLLLHSAPIDVLEAGEALGALAAARDEGKIRFAGVSGDNEAAAYAATLPDVAVVETSVNVCDQANVASVLPVARTHDVGVLAKRPVANAAWRAPEEQQGFYQNYSRPYHERFAKMGLTTPAALGLGELGWHEAALRFTLALPGIHCAIVGTTNPDNARSNVAAANAGPLPEDAVRRLRDAFARARDASGADWPGLR